MLNYIKEKYQIDYLNRINYQIESRFLLVKIVLEENGILEGNKIYKIKKIYYLFKMFERII